MAHPPVVVTDVRNENPRPGSTTDAHQDGLLHRIVHVEIVDWTGRYLISKRENGQYEIIGGHVDWLEKLDRAETSEEACLRETAAETRMIPTKYTPQEVETAKEELRRLANPRPVAIDVNQLPSSHGNNNEHVVVYRLTFPDDLKKRLTSVGDHGGTPEWLTEAEIVERAAQPQNRMRINAALRLFLRRRGVVVPLKLEFETEQQKPTVAGFGGYECVIRKKRDAGTH